MIFLDIPICQTATLGQWPMASDTDALWHPSASVGDSYRDDTPTEKPTGYRQLDSEKCEVRETKGP